MPAAVRRLHFVPWPVQKGAHREKALRRWRLIIEENFDSSKLGRQLHQGVLKLYDDQRIANTISDSFATKSANTLNKRSGPILRYLVWHRQQYGTSGLPFQEARIYDYARDQSTSATFTKSLVSALRFCFHFLGFESALESIESRRLGGAAHSQALNKRVLKQRRPLTKLEIIALEKLAVSAVCPYDRYAANFFLGQLYSRARYNDYCMSHALHSDFAPDGTGFLEAPTLFAKTQKSTEAKRTMMPQVAHRVGVTTTRWADNFLSERKQQGLE